MSVKRYGFEIRPLRGEIFSELVEHPHGDYVRYEDYAKLLAALQKIALASPRFGRGWDGDCGVIAIAEDALSGAGEP